MNESQYYVSIILSIFGFCILCNIAICVCYKNPYNIIRKYNFRHRSRINFLGKFSNVVQIEYDDNPNIDIRLPQYSNV